MKLLNINSKHDFRTVFTSELIYENEEGRVKKVPCISRRPVYSVEDINGYISGVAAIIMRENRYLLVTREFRLAVNKTVIGFPTGMPKIWESTAKTAEREVLEETGLTVKVTAIAPPCYINPAEGNEQLQVAYCKYISGEITGSDNANEECESFWLDLLNDLEFSKVLQETNSILSREILIQLRYKAKAEKKSPLWKTFISRIKESKLKPAI